MTKEITKAFILQEIQDKFKLRELMDEKFAFSELVIPTYGIEPHLETWETRLNYASITSGPSAFLIITVPMSEMWRLCRYDVVFMATGAYAITGVYIQRKNSGTNNIYLDMTLGQTASYHIELAVPMILQPGDRLYVYADSYTSTADLRIYYDIVVEEIR